MIGRLLQSAATTFSPYTTSKNHSPLESVTEEVHTSELLYPEVSSLRHPSQSALPLNDGRTPFNAKEAANYDDRGGLNISYPNDIRIIIAQDTTSRHPQPQVLYDSSPPPSAPMTPQDTLPKSTGEGRSRHELAGSKASAGSTFNCASPRHQRQSSMFKNSQMHVSSPTSPGSPDFRFRRSFAESGTPRSSTFEVCSGESETVQGRIAREGKEDTEALLSCMFGPPGFTEPGTKLHVIPRKGSDTANHTDLPSAINRPDSSGGFSRQRTPLMRSTSAADVTTAASANASGSERSFSSSSKSSLLITRLFSVQIFDSKATEPDHQSSGGNSRPVDENTDSSREAFDSTSAKGPNEIKTPIFAIGVILQLPNDHQRPTLRKGNLHQEVSSLGSSYDYMSQSPDGIWKPINISSPRIMSTQSIVSGIGGYGTINIHMSKVLAHWDSIGRALSSLEMLIRGRLGDILVYHSSFLPPSISAVRSTISVNQPNRVHHTSKRSVQVDPECLQNCTPVQREVVLTAQRIVSSLRTRRVVTGQGRWGAWREEARWVGRWAGGRDQNFFFFNLLTAFLGSHTVWMDSLVSSMLKRQATFRHPSRSQNSDVIHHRTVVVSEDKMAARRLIFLLAAFLPSLHTPPSLEMSQWPYLGNPALLYCPSPTSIPTARDNIQRRVPHSRPNGTRKNETTGHGRSVSFSLEGTENGSTNGGRSLGQPRHERRVSDARSIRGASLAIPTNGKSMQKTPISTVIANTTVPIPHFSNYKISDPLGLQRPESSGSVASVALNQTLKQSDSAGPSDVSGSGGRLGSMVSGFWSIRRGSSTDDSDHLASFSEGLIDSRLRKDPKKSSGLNKLDQMVEEIVTSSLTQKAHEYEIQNVPQTSDPLTQTSPNDEDFFPLEVTKARSIPETPKAKRTPLKLSVNEQDGTIDIELPPTGSFASSLTSSFGSSFIHRAIPSSLQDHFSPYGRPMTPDSPRLTGEPSVDVAGWLNRYHQDFSLQAVRPYGKLEEEVKESMMVEARVARCNNDKLRSNLSDDNWTEVRSTLIANTTTFSIKRLRLCHRRKSLPVPKETPEITLSRNDCLFEESFTSEPLMDMDPTLIDAVERVLAQSGRSSRVHSRAPSPVRSEHRSASMAEGPALEVPHGECRRMVLGALEQVVKSVREEMAEGRREMDGTLREGVRKWLGESDGRW